MKITAIYKITSIKTGFVYIGGTGNYVGRIRSHKSQLLNGIHKNKGLQLNFDLFGLRDFVFEIIEECLIDQVVAREQFYMDKLKPFFNMAPKAGTMLDYKHTVETKIKLSNKRRLRVIKQSTKLKLSDNAWCSKVVFNEQNGVFYNSIQEAANSIGKDRGHVSNMVNGKMRNTTHFKLV